MGHAVKDFICCVVVSSIYLIFTQSSKTTYFFDPAEGAGSDFLLAAKSSNINYFI